MAILTVHRRFQRLALVVAVFLVLYVYILLTQTGLIIPQHAEWRNWKYRPSSFDWGNRTQAHPVDESTMVHLPIGTPHQLPHIQHEFTRAELSEAHTKIQRTRRNVVRNVAKRSWRAYRDHAWGRDEVAPQKLIGKDTFAGWGATLVDSLDTLWIMDLKEDFRAAVHHVATIDWNNATSEHCSLFETNIRYLGGLLSAYDLSQERVLLDKAIELGDMLYAGFDTPNHMPANNFHFGPAKEGKLVAGVKESSAAAGTLSLEFTRLSQLTGDSKYYHAIDGVKKALERTQDSTNLPGMWPIFVDLQNSFFTPGTAFSLGASSDSAYEYLSKMHALLGGLDPTYEKLHTKAMATASKHMLFRPMLPDDLSPATTETTTTTSATPPDILFSGTVHSNGDIIDLHPEVQHLGCFAGGMFALGGRLFDQEEHVKIGEQLARGCAWAYEAFPTAVMPELSEVMACEKREEEEEEEKEEGDADTTEEQKEEEEEGHHHHHLAPPCAWNETRWAEKVGERAAQLPRPFSKVRNPQYLLRPEAIESLFVLYRITGKADLLDVAWRMFESVRKATRTKFAHSAISSVQTTGYTVKIDAMESFWIAETLKYFYLIFSEPELISLDEYVFNTEAHPFKLPKQGGGGTRLDR